MVSFDSRAAGTPVTAWHDSRIVQDSAQLDLAEVTKVVVVAAHPDDETLGAGGLIASLARRDVELTVVVVTDGAGSHPESTTHTPAALAEARRYEAAEAISALAPSARLIFLEVGDGETIEETEAIRTGIVALLAVADLVVAPWRGDGHRDHRVVGEICAELAQQRGLRLLEYPVWMWHWGSPHGHPAEALDWVAHPLDASSHAAKRIAIRAYRSQVDGLGDAPGDEPVLEAGFLAHFDRSCEFFIETPAAGGRAARAEAGELGAPYFDDLYRRRSDPWRLGSRWYERRKRAMTMASLPAERYSHGLEIGSSIGMLTSELADRCDGLLSLDISAAAVEQARSRLAGRDSVRIEHRDAVTDFPPGEFDLIVISEVGYYWSREVLEEVAANVAAALAAGGALVLCHWRHAVDDYLLSGDDVHRIVRASVDLDIVASHVEADFRLEVLSSDRRSVAQREGFLP